MEGYEEGNVGIRREQQRRDARLVMEGAGQLHRMPFSASSVCEH